MEDILESGLQDLGGTDYAVESFPMSSFALVGGFRNSGLSLTSEEQKAWCMATGRP